MDRKWVVNFRVIGPSHYHTPLMFIPHESTIVTAESPEAAWEKWVTSPYACPRDWYVNDGIEEAT